MPKMKTKRAAKKRFSLTAKGKAKIKKKGLRHILEKRSSNSKRKLRKTGYVHTSDMPHIRRLLPNG